MNKDLPTISVVTVTWNDLAGLELMAKSLQSQSYAKIEHVIVDGGSSDGTKEWLAHYGPAYPSTWVSEPDNGIFDAMNKGVRLASGDLVVFMNSGDCFSDSSVIDRVAEHWAFGSWRWGYASMRYVNEAREVTGAAIQFPFSKRRLEMGLAFAPHQATFIQRDFFHELGGFDDRFEYASDQEFAMRASRFEEPYVWLDFVADFLAGGVHSQSSYWHRERLYSQMRKKNGTLLFNSKVADAAYSVSVGTYREVRERVGRTARAMLVRMPRR